MGPDYLAPRNAKDSWQTLEATEVKGGFLPRNVRGSMAPRTPLFHMFSLQNFERIHLYCFKPPGLWPFVTAAKGNECMG